MTTRDGMLRFYRAYLDACNRRDWPAIGARVADRVLVNGVLRTRAEYVADIQATIAAFPDYHWELRRAVLDGEWLAVHLYDTATRPAGRADKDARVGVATDEFDMYQLRDGAIVAVEGTADNARLFG